MILTGKIGPVFSPNLSWPWRLGSDVAQPLPSSFAPVGCSIHRTTLGLIRWAPKWSHGCQPMGIPPRSFNQGLYIRAWHYAYFSRVSRILDHSPADSAQSSGVAKSLGKTVKRRCHSRCIAGVWWPWWLFLFSWQEKGVDNRLGTCLANVSYIVETRLRHVNARMVIQLYHPKR